MRVKCGKFLLIFISGITAFLLLCYLINFKKLSNFISPKNTKLEKFNKKAISNYQHPIVTKNNNNPIFYNKKLNSSEFVAGNCFFKKNNKLMLLYYAKYNDSTAIFLANSENGINFQNVFEEPILLPGDNSSWDNGGVSVFPNCIIKKNDGTYFLYYTGSQNEKSDIYHSGKIGLAVSKDLKNWTKHNSNPILTASKNDWDSSGVFESSIYFDGNEFGKKDAYKMWYGGSDKNLRFKIGYAESPNGVEWKKYKNNPVIGYSDIKNTFDEYSIEVHSVNKIFGKYIMFYEAIEQQFPHPFSIGMASSKDGVEWKKSELNPILSSGMVGDWDQMGAYHPSLVSLNGKLFLYYVGLDYKFEHRIGVAEINPNIFYMEKDSKNTPQ